MSWHRRFGEWEILLEGYNHVVMKPFACQVSLLTQKLKEHCKVEYQIKTFSGQTHGFVHRKREDCSPEDKPYIDEARRNLIEWLNKYV